MFGRVLAGIDGRFDKLVTVPLRNRSRSYVARSIVYFSDNGIAFRTSQETEARTDLEFTENDSSRLVALRILG